MAKPIPEMPSSVFVALVGRPNLLKYVQEHGNTYSLPRNLLIQFLESRD